MFEFTPTPPSINIIDGFYADGSELTATDGYIEGALAAAASLNFFLSMYPGKPDDIVSAEVDSVADVLVDSGAWRHITFDPDTKFAIEMNPEYQAARLRWIGEGGTADSTKALQDMARTAIQTLANRALQ